MNKFLVTVLEPDPDNYNNIWCSICDANDPKIKQDLLPDYTPEWLYDKIQEIDSTIEEVQESIFSVPRITLPKLLKASDENN